MNRAFVEILILVINALSADTLAYIAGVIQKVMNNMDEAEFQSFTKQLHKSMHKSPYLIITAELPKVVFIPYFIIFGFSNWWFTAGAIVAIAASVFVSKPIVLPAYKMIYESLKSSDVEGLSEWRRKLQTRNRFRAVLQFVSVILMVIGLFGVS